MIAIVYLVAISLCLGASALFVFLWALKQGQFEDLDGAANRILFDDDQSQILSPKNNIQR